MELVDLPSGSPAELLAWDEAFLSEAEHSGIERIWFWESATPFVVVGYGQSIDREVHRHTCKTRGIPILRRCSGGGTVVQGPGCLNYGLTLVTDLQPALQSVTGTNRHIMERQANALNRLARGMVVVRGHTDLALIQGDIELKFSGNAQRRTRRAILFHGTILHGMNLDWISELLPMPVDRPEYRHSRSHKEFLTHFPADPVSIRTTIAEAWPQNASITPLPWRLREHALLERYSHADWHEHRKTRNIPGSPG